MTFLSTLKYTAEAEAKPSPIERQRARLIANLQDQLIRLEDPLHARTQTKWVKDAQGKRLVEREIPVKPWWRSLPDGRVAFAVKTGVRKIEFRKGQTAISVDNKTALPALINGLITAAQNGEFDAFFKTPDPKRLVPAKKAA